MNTLRRCAGGRPAGGSHNRNAPPDNPEALLRRLPQRTAADGGAGARCGRRRQRRRGPGRVGEGGAEAAHPHHAARRAAAARCRHLRRAGQPPRARTRRRLDRTPEPGPAGGPAAEPVRVRQRHPRSVGAGSGRAGAAASRRVGLRFRQHRRCPVGVARAAGTVRPGRREDQPLGARRPNAAAGHRAVQDLAADAAGRPRERRSAVRVARRPRGATPLPARRRVHPARAARAGPARVAPARDPPGPRSGSRRSRWGAATADRSRCASRSRRARGS